mmetsp:Transcript_829/g.1042  ORF Transcript_829/g.1042 Transcript_829/m.1042 type:complete len:353 (+) Transcript_829:44-1102(+)
MLLLSLPESESALASLHEEAQQLSHFLSECKTVPRESIVMMAVMDTVTVVLQRAEIALFQSKIKDHGLLSDFVSEESNADSVITRGMREEICHLDNLLTDLYVSARGQRKGQLALPSKECPPLLFKAPPPDPEPETPTWFTEYAANAPPFEESIDNENPNETFNGKAKYEYNAPETPDVPPTIPQAPLAVPAGTALSDFPRLPPDWDFPKCTTKELFRQYWLPDFKTGAPAIHTLGKNDVRHLKRGGRNLNEVKRLVQIIEDEARRKDIWKEDPETEEEVDWIFEQCRDRIETLIEPLTRKRRFQLAWQTDIRYIREAIKKRKDEEELAHHEEGGHFVNNSLDTNEDHSDED